MRVALIVGMFACGWFALLVVALGFGPEASPLRVFALLVVWVVLGLIGPWKMMMKK